MWAELCETAVREDLLEEVALHSFQLCWWPWRS